MSEPHRIEGLPSPPMIRCAQAAAAFMEKCIYTATGEIVCCSDRKKIRMMADHFDEGARINALLDTIDKVIAASPCECGTCDLCNLKIAYAECLVGGPVPLPPEIVKKRQSDQLE